MSNYKPLHDFVIVKPVADQQETKSGIVLPDTVDKERPEKGEVVAVGAGKVLDNGSRKLMDVKVGDIVIFKKYSPDEVPGEEGLLLLSEGDILAIEDEQLTTNN